MFVLIHIYIYVRVAVEQVLFSKEFWVQGWAGIKTIWDPWICHMCKSSAMFLSPKLSIYTETSLRSPQINFIPRFDVPACGSLAAEMYAFVSIYTMAHNICAGFDSVFILGPSGHESLNRNHELRKQIS